MANPPCPWCGSRLIRQDRSLGGRTICGSCGRPRQGGRGDGGGPRRSRGSRGSGRRLLLWLLPIGLLLLWLWLRR